MVRNLFFWEFFLVESGFLKGGFRVFWWRERWIEEI